MGRRNNTKTVTGSSRRSLLARRFLGLEHWRKGPLGQLTVWQVAAGLILSVVVAGIVAGYQFQSIPDYNEGDIADRTIEAPRDFQVVDLEATDEMKREIMQGVPGVFDLDLSVNHRLESELKSAFADARRIISAVRTRYQLGNGQSFPRRLKAELLSELSHGLPRFAQGKVLEICLARNFSSELEDQMLAVLRESMKSPGVILNRQVLLHYRDRGIILQNAITGRQEPLDDWIAIRDLGQARDVLRQNEYELTAVGRVAKKQVISFLDTWVVPNVSFNERATRDLEDLASEEVDQVLVQVRKGRTLVRSGDEIGAREILLLGGLKSMEQPSRVAGKFFGVLIMAGFFLFALGHYAVTAREAKAETSRYHVLLPLVLLCTLVVCKAFVVFADFVVEGIGFERFQNPVDFYLVVPAATGAIIAVLLTNVPLTVFFALTFAVFMGLMTGEGLMIVYTLAGSLAAVHALDQYRERSTVTRAGLIIGLVNVAIALGYQLTFVDVGFDWLLFLLRSACGLVSGVIAAMLASLLLPILESLFKITTDVRLLELSNLNNPVLRRLALEAPGTYHHSITVGTLAEAGAEAIGANNLLVRVGAYYHDIGKLKAPEYYVENQIYTGNKHDNLTPNMSSLILGSHVKDGLAIADEIKLIPKVRDLIPQHHGTRVMKYFYEKAKEAARTKGLEVSESEFRYPGPKPQTREAAILMLADQVEAASRTLEDPGPGQIRSMIQRLTQSTMEDGQFDDCDVTIKDLGRVGSAFERVLRGMYHHRVEYPGFEFNKRIDEGRRPHPSIQ